MLKRTLTPLLLAVILTCNAQAQQTPPGIVGSWLGTLVVNENMSLRMGLDVQAEGEGVSATFASVDQGAYGIEVAGLVVSGDSLHFEVPAVGMRYAGRFTGPDAIEGQIAQGTAPPLSLGFERVEAIPGAPPPRHQNPVRPYPYLDEEVTFAGAADGLTLAGTLTLPREGTGFPAVVLITGSGANDRDETIWGHKVFLVLADHLTREGIAVLRVDDRGVGGSTGDFASASISDFADDAAAAVRYLLGREEIDAGRVGLIGHSLGGDIAPLAANRSPEVDFMVLLAGSGITLAETIHFQTEHIYSGRGASAAAIDLNRRINQAAFDASAMEGELEAREVALAEVLSELVPELEAMTPEDRALAELPDELLAENYRTFLTGPMRFDLFYNPSHELRRFRHPVLILAGEKDTQVLAHINVPLMEGALAEAGNESVTTVLFPSVNHLFQTSETGEIDEYLMIGETMAPVVLQMISDWIHGLR
jgi:pimeloyl-ACP methyl ester carboxylesterase